MSMHVHVVADLCHIMHCMSMHVHVVANVASNTDHTPHSNTTKILMGATFTFPCVCNAQVCSIYSCIRVHARDFHLYACCRAWIFSLLSFIYVHSLFGFPQYESTLHVCCYSCTSTHVHLYVVYWHVCEDAYMIQIYQNTSHTIPLG